MYFPIGWPIGLSISPDHLPIVSITCNTDRSLFALLSARTLSIWYCKPSITIVRHERHEESVNTFGHNLSAVWRPDSTMIVVRTSNDYLLFYKMMLKNASDTLLDQKDVNISGLKRESAELFIPEKIPALTLVLAFTTQMKCGITCVMAAEEEVVMGSKFGEMVGVNWDGTIDQSFAWKLCPSNQTNQSNLIDLKYSSMIGGFSLVFSNGRAAFMPIHSQYSSQPSTPDSPSPNSSTHYNSRLQFVPDIDNATCTAINHKYQLIAFGLRNSEGILCCLEDTTQSNSNTVIITNRLILSSSAYPEASVTAGAMINLQWTPDSNVLATAWEKRGFALWSVYGALLACSLSWDFGELDSCKSNMFRVLSMTWGKEGYHLWISSLQSKKSTIPANQNENEEKDIDSEKIKTNEHSFSNGVYKICMAKSVLASNPSCTCTGELVLLTAEDRLFVGVGAVNVGQQQQQLPKRFGTNERMNKFVNTTSIDDVLPSTNVSNGDVWWEQQPIAVGNHQWMVISMPQSYLSSNWPIRYAAIDLLGQHIAIAGRSGMAHYSMVQRKWKMFGNETQEKDFEVCGGLLWWEEHVVLSCYNAIESRFEMRVYPQKTKLDNQFVRVSKVPNEVLLMSMFNDRLLAYLIDGSLQLFAFHQKPSSASASSSSSSSAHSSSSLHLIHLNHIVICNLIVPPECVTSIVLSNLHIETRKNQSEENCNSILMNVCGRLFLLEQESFNSTGQAAIVYKGVSILASGVENMWVSNVTTPSDRPHLTESLWLSCGANGMGVWLPLNIGENEQTQRTHNFMSKRIMLPISTNIYPLAVLFRDAVVLGAENDTILFSRSSPVSHPFSVVSRTSQVYLHHILRELLKRNLGDRAWEIANSCITLPYFPHSLELLLHEILEEEATSSHPIPDALLPRVIDFIREFPVFLQTVVHCARKTELALWPHLFSVVGNPKELFQRCLKEGQLETAASYIIILQNLERTSVSRQYASQLLDSALDAGCWQLAKDLLRFLRAIDPLDIETPPSKAAIVASGPSAHPHSMKYVMIAPTPLAGDSVDNFNQVQSQQHPASQVTTRKRTQSNGSTSLMLHQSTDGKPQSEPHAIPQRRGSITTTTTHKISSSSPPVNHVDELYLDTILARHARQLLYDGSLKELGLFAAHLDFHLVSFLKKEQARAAKVDDFVQALLKLHSDFEWPLPYVNPTSFSPGFYRKDSGLGSSTSPSIESSSEVRPAINNYSFSANQISNKMAIMELNNDLSKPTHSQLNQFQSKVMNTNNSKSTNNHPSSTSNTNYLPKEVNLSPKSYDIESVQSPSEDTNSLWGNDSQMDENDINWIHSADVDALAQELVSQGGSPLADVQLRYLFQLMLEAECLCWSFLIAMMLRDILAVSRVFSAAKQSDVNREMVVHLKQGIDCLQQWVSSNAFNGYRTFMLQVKNQMKSLSNIFAAHKTCQSNQSKTGSVDVMCSSSSLSIDLDDSNELILDRNNTSKSSSGVINSSNSFNTRTASPTSLQLNFINSIGATPGKTTRTNTSNSSSSTKKSPSSSIISNSNQANSNTNKSKSNPDRTSVSQQSDNKFDPKLHPLSTTTLKSDFSSLNASSKRMEYNRDLLTSRSTTDNSQDSNCVIS